MNGRALSNEVYQATDIGNLDESQNHYAEWKSQTQKSMIHLYEILDHAKQIYSDKEQISGKEVSEKEHEETGMMEMFHILMVVVDRITHLSKFAEPQT